MSVVNQMLKDLDARKAPEGQVSGDYQAPQRSKLLYLAGLLGLALVIGVLGWWLSSNQAPVQQQPIKDVDAFFAQAAVKPQPPSQPVTAPRANLEAAAPAETTQNITAEPALARPPAAPLHQAQTVSKVIVEPQPPEHSHEKAPVVFAVSSSPRHQPPNLRQQAQAALQSGDKAKAVELLQALLKTDPQDLKVRKKLAALQFAAGATSQAEQLLLAGLRQHPENLSLRMMLARLYFQQQQLSNAHQVLQSHQVSATQDPEYVAFRASIAQQLARYQDAAIDYLDLIKQQAGNSRWWLGLGIVEDKLGNLDKALNAYRQADTLGQLSEEVSMFVNQRIQYLAKGH